MHYDLAAVTFVFYLYLVLYQMLLLLMLDVKKISVPFLRRARYRSQRCQEEWKALSLLCNLLLYNFVLLMLDMKIPWVDLSMLVGDLLVA